MLLPSHHYKSAVLGMIAAGGQGQQPVSIGFNLGHGNSPFLNNSAGRQHPLLSPLVCSPAKTGGAVNGGRSPFILTVDWLGWLCYFLPNEPI